MCKAFHMLLPEEAAADGRNVFPFIHAYAYKEIHSLTINRYCFLKDTGIMLDLDAVCGKYLHTVSLLPGNYLVFWLSM
jgi:hypothetical protein